MSEVVECDVLSTRAGGGERRESDGVDLLARITCLDPRMGKFVSSGAMEPRFGLFNTVPGLETGNSPRALGLIVVPSPFAIVVPVRGGSISLEVMASGTSRIDPLTVAGETL